MALDTIVIAELSVAIVVVLTMGIITAARSKSLTNRYFSAVFFVIAARSIVGLGVRISSMFLGSNPLVVKIYIILIHTIPAFIICESIIYGAGFYIINFGEKFYRDRKGILIFLALVILIPIGLFSFYWLDGMGFEFQAIPNGEYENFVLMLPLGITIMVLIGLFSALSIYLLIRILPDTTNRKQKWKIIAFLAVVLIVFFSTVNLVLVDMQILRASWIGIGSIMNLLAIVLLFISIVRKN